jgi:hypothetical protein
MWLEDYRLACHAGGATDDLFVITNLPLYLGDSACTWLEHLPHEKINDWTDLRRVFIDNFQGMYMRPGKQWELRNCKKQPGKSRREYIRHFSKRCTELPSATDNDAILGFRMVRCAPPSSTDSSVACRARPVNSSTSRATMPMARRQ